MNEPEFTGGIVAPARHDKPDTTPLPFEAGDIDLTGVDPLRRAEVRRRVAVVRSFLTIMLPNDDDRRRHAQMLDLSVNQFKALVRAWLAHPSAGSVAQSGVSRGKPRPAGPLQLDAEVKATAEATVAELSPTATLAQAVEAVASACTARGLDVPKATTVWKMLTAARRLVIDTSARGNVVVGRCRLRLPVMEDETLVMPSIGLVIRADDGVIVGATTRADAVSDAALVALATAQPGLAVVEIDDELKARPLGTDATVTPFPASTIRRRLSRILGNRLGKLKPVYKAGAERRPERLLKSRTDRPLSRADAAVVIRAAIDAHNAERGGDRAVWID